MNITQEKLLILVNRRNSKCWEYSTMMLQIADNAITIGANLLERTARYFMNL
jgi:hypothetical protein